MQILHLLTAKFIIGNCKFLFLQILQKYHLQVTDEVKLVMRFLGTVDQPVKLQLRPRFLTEN